MKILFRDRAALANLVPLHVKAYLHHRGWTESERIGDKAAVYTYRRGDERAWEILVPLRSSVADYAECMAEVLVTLSEVEKRSEPAIFDDLSTTGADVIRIRAPEASEGTMAISDGVRVYEEAENLLLAAACAVERPGRASYYAPRKFAKASEYLQSARLGQTERGSYVLTILSPVGPTLRQPVVGAVEDEPFARAVTHTLTRALGALEQAVERAAASDDFADFERAVEHGVSANLCEAVAQMTHRAHGLDIGLSWALVRPAPMANPHHRFTVDSARIVEEAAREFRRDESRPDESVTGFVVQLDRQGGDNRRSATLKVLLDGRYRSIKVHFQRDSDYSDAIFAFEHRVEISLDGDIRRVGHRYELREPRNVVVSTVDYLDDAPDDLPF
ncbi:hypothetical protein [Haliangium sp.]|uniref:hypothetical protein n=1 Tax=Haliangium sp. TaxID=2663208 RepID=UPI003D12EA09